MQSIDIDSDNRSGGGSSGNDTDPESATQSLTDGNATGVTRDGNKVSSRAPRKLSSISKLYDINGDGELDAAESAMRDMDVSNRGFLTNDKIYSLMQEQLETRKQLVRIKWIVFGLLALVVILAISNLGTSFAAASLSKDTTISSNAELADKHTQEALSTQTSTDSISFDRATITPDGRRILCNIDDGDVNCSLNGSSSFRSIDENMCRKMISECKRGNTVNLSRTWKNGDVTSFNICPFNEGNIRKTDVSKFVNNKGQSLIFEMVDGGHCKISGDAVAQSLGNICEVGDDCAAGLECRKDDSFVAQCKKRCAMRRWAPRKVLECQNVCDYPSCLSDVAESV